MVHTFDTRMQVNRQSWLGKNYYLIRASDPFLEQQLFQTRYKDNFVKSQSPSPLQIPDLGKQPPHT